MQVQGLAYLHLVLGYLRLRGDTQYSTKHRNMATFNTMLNLSLREFQKWQKGVMMCFLVKV